ncbi:MAG: monovalent cation/H(+) antiporter subunit G [Methanophagales archaeon ANME-1-THS]|nr:MAG: monovalent cation/H(+) antiporter subunit G [Methanophagales archaeon ANME-1-THS]
MKFRDFYIGIAGITFIIGVILAVALGRRGIVDTLAVLFLAAGAFFIITGVIGLLKFPDFYTRLHATGKCDTVGQIFIVVGCMIYSGLSLISVKLFFVAAFYLLAYPSATHAIMKAAYATGLKPWKKGDPRM